MSFQALGGDWTNAEGKKSEFEGERVLKRCFVLLQVDRGVVPSAVVVLGGRPGPCWHCLMSTAGSNTSQPNSNWKPPLDGKSNCTPVLHSHWGMQS